MKKLYTTAEVADLLGRATTSWLKKRIRVGAVQAEKVPGNRGPKSYHYGLVEEAVKSLLAERLVDAIRRVTLQMGGEDILADILQTKSHLGYDPTQTPKCIVCGNPSGYPGGGMCLRCYRVYKQARQYTMPKNLSCPRCGRQEPLSPGMCPECFSKRGGNTARRKREKARNAARYGLRPIPGKGHSEHT